MITRALTRAEVETSLAGFQTEIVGLGVRRLALFGSVQRNTARLDSDVDVLVEFQPGEKSYDRFFALGELLERVLGRPVDLVTTEALSPFLKPYILSEAQDVVRAA